jgi:hypothetical protein
MWFDDAPQGRCRDLGQQNQTAIGMQKEFNPVAGPQTQMIPNGLGNYHLPFTGYRGLHKNFHYISLNVITHYVAMIGKKRKRHHRAASNSETPFIHSIASASPPASNKAI